MELKAGYKVTEVGVIPKDWETVFLFEISRKITDGEHVTPRREKSGYFLLSARNVLNGRIDISDVDFVGRDEFLRIRQRCNPEPGDLLISCSGTIGRVTVVPEGFECVLVRSAALVKPIHEKVNSYFIQHWLQSERAQKQISNSVNQGAQPNLFLNHIERLTSPRPNLLEQQAIAEALSDADALIESLDQLIAKKRQIKHGAMQELLTGKRRLPGFEGEWEVKKLEQLGEVSGSGVDKKIRVGEVPVRLLNYMDVYRRDFIYSKDLDHWVTAPSHQLRRCVVEKGDIFFTPSSETRDDIANSAVSMEDVPNAAYSYHVVRLRLKEDWDLLFRTYAFKTREFLGQAETLCDGSGTRYVISLSKFRNITIRVPEPKEQAAIADVLWAMDQEIALLEVRLSKARQIKQGMMQELLTGRTRLL